MKQPARSAARHARRTSALAVGTVVAALLVTALTACGGSGPQPTPTASQSAAAASTATPTARPTAKPTARPTARPPTPSAPNAEALLGEPVDGSVVSAFLDAVPCRISGGHYKCLRDGIEFSLNGRLDVDTVFLFAEGVADNSEYSASLPFGLTWGMTRDETEALLGTPDFRSEILPDFDNTYTSVYRQITDQPFRTMSLGFNSSLELQEVDLSTST